jgi:Holliday junction resolvase RusA-like endonuclease
LKLTVHAWFRRPAAHYGTGRNAGVLKAWAPRHVTKTPDVDNIAKLVGDALNGYAWHDDSQIAAVDVQKTYLDPDPGGPRIRIVIERLDRQPVGGAQAEMGTDV